MNKCKTYYFSVIYLSTSIVEGFQNKCFVGHLEKLREESVDDDIPEQNSLLPIVENVDAHIARLILLFFLPLVQPGVLFPHRWVHVLLEVHLGVWCANVGALLQLPAGGDDGVTIGAASED